MSVIRTENLTYTYSQGTPFEKTAVKDVNIEIEEGELVGIIGHTGSGKSTLIQHLNGLIKPTSGKIFIDGVDIHDKDIKLRDVRFKVGLVFQYPEYQIFEETVYKDIAFGPTNMGLDEGEIDKRVRETAKLVGIDDSLLNKSPFELSGGQKQRISIARAFLKNPPILILDEATSALDNESERIVQASLEKLAKGRTTFTIAHRLTTIKNATKILVLTDKGIEEAGTHQELMKKKGIYFDLYKSYQEMTADTE